MTASIDTIRDDFSLLDEWEDRYRYVIELGEALPDFPDAARIDAFKVPGCVSQVWLTTDVGAGDGQQRQSAGNLAGHSIPSG